MAPPELLLQPDINMFGSVGENANEAAASAPVALPDRTLSWMINELTDMAVVWCRLAPGRQREARTSIHLSQ